MWGVIVVIVLVATMLAVTTTWASGDGDDGGISIVRVRTRAEQKQWSAVLRRFEVRSAQLYPVSEADSFRIDHGRDYFAFFRRMSMTVHVRLCVVTATKEVVGSGCSVLRRLSPDWRHPEQLDDAWYICDLRVLESFRGRRLPSRMLLGTVLSSYLQCSRCFAVIMHDGTIGKVLRLADRVRVRLRPSCVLRVYSLGQRAMLRAQPLLESERGPLCYRSMADVKRFVLTSTGKTMRMLHVNFHRFDRALVHVEPFVTNPMIGFRHMFCLPENDPLICMLDMHGIRSHVRATVLSYGMDHHDFAALQTSEI